MALNDAPSVDTVQCLVLMRYVAAYMLAALGTKGDASPTAADVEKILSSVGIEAEADKVKKIVSELKGKNLEELIEAGTKKLASVPSGGAAPAAAPAAAAAAPAEAKKEEKKAETESEDDDMGFGLFD